MGVSEQSAWVVSLMPTRTFGSPKSGSFNGFIGCLKWAPFGLLDCGLKLFTTQLSVSQLKQHCFTVPRFTRAIASRRRAWRKVGLIRERNYADMLRYALSERV